MPELVFLIGGLAWLGLFLFRRRSPGAASSGPLRLLMWISGCAALAIAAVFIPVLWLLVTGFGP